MQIARVFTEALRPDLLLLTEDCYSEPGEIARMVARDLTGDPVFGRMNGFTIRDFADPSRVAAQSARLSNASGGLVAIVGTGTELLAADPDLLIYADMARWEIQQRYRASQVPTWGAEAGRSARYEI